MGSKFVTSRIPADLYDQFQEKCSNEDSTVSQKVRQFIDDYLYPSSQSKDAAPSEAEEGKKPNTEERFSALEERLALNQRETDNRIKPIERDIEQIGESQAIIREQLNDIQEMLSEMTGGDTESEPAPAPGEIGVEAEHLGRVQPGSEKPGEEKKAEAEAKEETEEENEPPWPFNLSFCKPLLDKRK